MPRFRQQFYRGESIASIERLSFATFDCSEESRFHEKIGGKKSAPECWFFLFAMSAPVAAPGEKRTGHAGQVPAPASS
jgi:hypothetical protein